MKKTFAKKIAEIAAKLENANDKEAHRILYRLQYGDYLEKARLSLVRKNFAIDQNDAVDLIFFQLPRPLNLIKRKGVGCSWYNSKNPEEYLHFALNCVDLKKICVCIALTKKAKATSLERKIENGICYFNQKQVDEDGPLTPPEELVKIIADLGGFVETSTGFWIRPLGRADNLSQFKRKIQPAYEEIYHAISLFGEKWGEEKSPMITIDLTKSPKDE